MLVNLVHVHVKPEHVDTKTNGSKAGFSASRAPRLGVGALGKGTPFPAGGLLGGHSRRCRGLPQECYGGATAPCV